MRDEPCVRVYNHRGGYFFLYVYMYTYTCIRVVYTYVYIYTYAVRLRRCKHVRNTKLHSCFPSMIHESARVSEDATNLMCTTDETKTSKI